MSSLVKLIIGFVLGIMGKELPPDAQSISEKQTIVCTYNIAQHSEYLINTPDQDSQSKNELYVLKIKTH